MTKLALAARKGHHGTVECGRPSCRRRLPGVLRYRDTGGWHGGKGDLLFLGQGWHWDDAGRWSVTARAANSAEFMRGSRDDAKRRPWRSHDPVAVSEGAEGFLPHNLPIVLVCPYCHTPQRAEPVALDVDPRPHEHRLTTRARVGGGLEQLLCCEGGTMPAYIDAALRRDLVDD